MHRLRKFAEKHGHARVPYRYVTADGHKLGSWVAMQRHWRDRLSPEQERLLEEEPGWIWDVRRDREKRWDAALRLVCEYAAKHGHSRVPFTHLAPDGKRVGRWVSQQRHAYHLGRLSVERQRALEGVTGWVWKIKGRAHGASP